MHRWDGEWACAGSARHDPIDRAGEPDATCGRVQVSGRFFTCAGSKWYVAGLTYGPFEPNAAGEPFPSIQQAVHDLAHMRRLGATALRLYHPPPRWLLDQVQINGLKVLIDVPWQKHRCFFEDWSARKDALASVQRAAASCGSHPATFALSVANEIPKDIVRFYGARRVEQFLAELMDAARERAPECLVTYTNYPSTEFLSPPGADFLCFNVYLERQAQLSPYLDRLQHLAGSRPLILGEFGLDALRNGAQVQAQVLAEHVHCVFRRGLAGSFVFSYTDDWFTGGHRIKDWAFGVTDRSRNEKPAATALSKVWATVPDVGRELLPKVSVVVCSYNGARTLTDCLRAICVQDYPDYEVILIDDGSTDQTPAIAAQFPKVRYLHQSNLGLSAARNTGARVALGRIVAYTDSDCVADDKWLHYLVTAMVDQEVDAIGGPNIPPTDDCMIARCVAASPGGPSHVMLDDRYAEHVPGCNMAFDRERLLALGGFDPQFRVAGDDVDICWRFTDARLRIGYAPAALVWHHRRHTVRGYFRQQKGYGRAEAMLSFKHPLRFNAIGQARWHGVIYGEGAIGLPLAPHRTWHGRFGTGLFQVVYAHNQYSLWAWPTMLEWHAVWLVLLASGVFWKPIAFPAVLMAAISLIAAWRSTRSAPLPSGAPRRFRVLVYLLHLCQPVVRGAQRYRYRLENKSIPSFPPAGEAKYSSVKRISVSQRDMYWKSRLGKKREDLLLAFVEVVGRAGWRGVFDSEWERWDCSLFGGRWHQLYLHTATEDLGGGRSFTRLRCTIRTTRLTQVLLACASAALAAALAAGRPIVAALAATSLLAVGTAALFGRQRCWRAFVAAARTAGAEAGLEPVSVRAGNDHVPAQDFQIQEPANVLAR